MIPQVQPFYDVGTLMTQARKLAADYYHATGQVFPVSGELAKYDAVRLLNLKESPTQQAGVDAKTQEDKNVLIKSRVIFDETKSGQRIGQFNFDSHWQIVVLVIFDKQYQPIEIYQTTREEIEAAISESSRNKRGMMSVARFKSISELAWPNNNGY